MGRFLTGLDLAALGAGPAQVTKLLRSVARGITPLKTVMAGVTLTQGTVGANSTLDASKTVTAPTYSAIDPRYFAPIGGPLTPFNGGYAIASTQNTSGGPATDRLGSHGHGGAFWTSDQVVEFAVNTNGSPIMVYVYDPVTGLTARFTAADQATTTGNSYFKLDFGATLGAGSRLVKVHIGNRGAVFFGVTPATTGAVWAPTLNSLNVFQPADQFRLAMVWDSWGGGTGSGNTNGVKLTVPDFIGERLGITDPISSALGGTGMIAVNGNAPNYLTRIQRGDIDVARIGKLDGVLIPNSVNDNSQTDPAVQAQNTLVYAAARTAQPDALIWGCGPQYSSVGGQTPTQSRFDACQAGFMAALGSDPMALWMDMSPAGNPPVTAANAASFLGPDGTHPKDPGMPHYGYRYADAMIAAVRAKFPLA